MSDLEIIKKRIFDEEKIGFLLDRMECQDIKPKSNRYEAMLPERFNSSNTRSVQVFLSEALYCAVRSRGISNINIFGLVSYIVFGFEDEESIRKNLYNSKKWICDQLKYSEYLQGYVPEPETDDPLKWLKKIKKQRPKELHEMEENKIYDDSILNQYVMIPSYKFYKEGLSHKIQTEYEIGFDVQSERIIFPIRNEFGEIVSIKGRTTDPNYKINGIPKFLYYYPYNKSIEWYHWHIALYYVLEKKEIIIFEAEKSCWSAAEYGYRNTIAIGGSDISMYQVELLKKLPLDTRIILAFDKDKESKDILKEAKKLGYLRPVFTFWDKEDLLSLELKQSPTDAGKEIFEFLYQDSLHRRLNKV